VSDSVVSGVCGLCVVGFGRPAGVRRLSGGLCPLQHARPPVARAVPGARRARSASIVEGVAFRQIGDNHSRDPSSRIRTLQPRRYPRPQTPPHPGCHSGAAAPSLPPRCCGALDADARVAKVDFIPSEASLRVFAEEMQLNGRNALAEKLLGPGHSSSSKIISTRRQTSGPASPAAALHATE